MMRSEALVQLRDSLAELLHDNNSDRGVFQATYLLESLRRLLVDDRTQIDLKGSPASAEAHFRFTCSMWESICFLHEANIHERRRQ